LLQSGQAQKEVTHNEAVAMADMLMQSVIVSVAPGSVPASPSFGQCWIVGAGASGAWAAHDHALACWTSGGWRFAAAFSGMSVWSLADNAVARFDGSGWIIGRVEAAELRVNGTKVVGARAAAIPGPSGGTTIDSEGRLVLESILSALRTHGLIAP
jgi:hypothetical protein